MMRKIASCAMILVTAASLLSADDFDFGELLGGDEGGAVVSAPALEVGGSLSVPFRAGWGNMTDGKSWDRDSMENGSCTVDPDLKLDLSFSSDKADFKAVINANEGDLEDNLFDELSLTFYGDNVTTALGWQKVVWGKGDKVHVLDLLNPMDYTDFLNPDYLDRKIAQPMISVSIPHSLNGRLELVYVPFFNADKMATEGRWMMNEMEKKVTGVTGIVTAQAAGIVDTYSRIMFLSKYSSIDAFLPDTNTLEYGQAGTRLTATLGQVDLGAIYYVGRNRTPSVSISGTTVSDISVSYDPLQVFGMEVGTVLAGFNLRGEGAYYMTGDLEGDDPEVHNNSVKYVAGFDRDIPVHNVNVNIQVAGGLVMNHDKTADLARDVENGSDATETTLLCNISDSFNHEKIKPEVILTYRAEDSSGMVKPSLDWDVDGNLSFTFGGTILWGEDDSFFGQFDDNDYVFLNAEYQF